MHTAILVIANFVTLSLLPAWNGWLAAGIIAAACPFMVSDYKSYKTAGSHWLAGLTVVIMAGLVLVIRYAP